MTRKTANILQKNVKFINGCKANNDTHKTAKVFLTSNICGPYIIAIDLRNSPHGLTCEFLLKLSIIGQTSVKFSILAWLTFYVDVSIYFIMNVIRYFEAGYQHFR